MKRGQRILATMLIIISLLTILPVSAFASTKIETLQYGKWYKEQDYEGKSSRLK